MANDETSLPNQSIQEGQGMPMMQLIEQLAYIYQLGPMEGENRQLIETQAQALARAAIVDQAVGIRLFGSELAGRINIRGYIEETLLSIIHALRAQGLDQNDFPWESANQTAALWAGPGQSGTFTELGKIALWQNALEYHQTQEQHTAAFMAQFNQRVAKGESPAQVMMELWKQSRPS